VKRPALAQGFFRFGQHRFFLLAAIQLPKAQAAEQRDGQHRQPPAEQLARGPTHAHISRACDNTNLDATGSPLDETAMNDSLKTLLIIAFLIVILWNLGAGLYYLLVDKGQSKRTVNALTRRIAFSVALILLVALGIYTGVIKPHGIGG
jgi:hypothetical protein